MVLKEGNIITQRSPQTSLLLYELQQLLVQIKSCSELADKSSIDNINHLSKYGLNLLHYALFAIESQQTELPLTSVSAAAALSDVYFELKPLAKAYGAELKFEASHNLEPVYANQTSVKGSVYALVAALLTSTNCSGSTITIAVQQTMPKNQRIGIYSENLSIKPSLISKSLNRLDKVQRMSIPDVTHRSGLGFAVSKELAERLNAKYHSFEHQRSKGVGFYLPESAQLSFL